MKNIIKALLLLALFPSLALANCEQFKRDYGNPTTIDFNLWLPDGTAHYTSTAPVAGDILVSSDEAAEANCGTSSGNCVTDEGRFYSLALTGGELTAARVHIDIHDVSGAAFLDHCIEVETYNSNSAQHHIPDVNVASTSVGALAHASFAAGALDNTNLADGTISAAKLATDTITAAKIADDAITAAKIAQNAIGDSELADTLTVSITGTLSGSVGSVVGNVGGNVVGTVASVTGNVGGNVVGNVSGRVIGAVASVDGNVGGNVVGNVSGNVVGSVGSVAGNVAGNVAGTVGSVTGPVGSVTGNVGGNVNGNLVGTIGGMTVAALKDFFDTNSGTTQGASVAGSVVSEISTNCSGGGGGGGGTCTSIADGAIKASTFANDVIGHDQQAQLVTRDYINMAAAENFYTNALKDNFSILITATSTGNGAWQLACICSNDGSTDKATFCKPLPTLPTGTVKYAVIPTPNCNPLHW